ncbi:MAG: hypothetical protein LBC03_03380 [Nitrososphaerota archaeon]|nr:hypothetical protein [Nitrososphaerota archaeon]
MTDEQCKNPLNPKCQNKDICMYLQIGQDRYAICHQCWADIAESDVEWDEEGLKTKKENAQPPNTT